MWGVTGQKHAKIYSYCSLQQLLLNMFFSILSASFSDRQELVLKDYIETSLMLQILCRSALLHHVLVEKLAND